MRWMSRRYRGARDFQRPVHGWLMQTATVLPSFVLEPGSIPEIETVLVLPANAVEWTRAASWFSTVSTDGRDGIQVHPKTVVIGTYQLSNSCPPSGVMERSTAFWTYVGTRR